jgi:hypothetical protein
MKPPLTLIEAFAKAGYPVVRSLNILRSAGYAIRTQTYINIYKSFNPVDVIENKIKRLRFDKIIPDNYFIPTSAIWTGKKYRIEGTISVYNLDKGTIETRPFNFTTNKKLTRGQLNTIAKSIFSKMTEQTNIEFLGSTTNRLWVYDENS